MSSSKAVNRPVDLKQKEKDVNNKLQLFGIFQGMSPLAPNGCVAIACPLRRCC